MNSSYFENQLDALINEYLSLKRPSKYDDGSDVIDKVKILELVTRSRAAIIRISGRESVYSQQAEKIEGQHYFEMQQLTGIMSSLLLDLRAGYLRHFAELIHGEVFSDFLEMAEHLRDAGYKDPAAVIAGSALESHLRQLAKKFGVSTGVQPSGRPKKAEQLNSDLAGAAAYKLIDQKNVTAWLDIRNKAAHGHYGEYSTDQVALFISAIRDFLTRNPA